MSKDDDCKETEDVLIPGPFQTPDGGVPFIRHTADHQTVTGVMYRCEEGKPLMGQSCFALSPREDGLMRVEEVHTGGAPQSASKGPAKVNNAAFRSNWETIFGKKAPVGEA